MPEAIAVALIYLVPATAATIIGTVTIASVLSYGILLVGTYEASQLLTKKPGQQPSSAVQAQIPIRQPLPSRLRSYGRVKIGGAIAFEEVDGGGPGVASVLNSGGAALSAGNLWVQQLIGQGEIDAIEEHWLGDDQMLLATTGYAATSYGGSIHGGGSIGAPSINYGGWVKIVPQLGTADQLAQVDLVAAFAPDFTSDFRWRGVPNVSMIFVAPNTQGLAEALYPYGPPNYRSVQRAAKIYDVRDGTQIADGDPDRPSDNNWAWSQNAALIILDFLRHPDGWARWVDGAGARQMVPIAQFNIASFQAFADLSDQAVPLKGGGTVARYILSGTYDMTVAPKTTLDGMLAGCDGEIYRDGEGLIAIRGGAWGPAPTVTIGDADILQHSLKPGSNAFAACNRINATFTSARNDYQQIDMDPWFDQADIDQTGEELPTDLDLTWVPNHSQARRLAKIKIAKLNPAWSGTVTTGPRGLLAFGERLINQQIPELNIDGSFLLTAFGPSPDLSKADLTVAAFDGSCYDWDAENEEGTPAPIGTITLDDTTVPPPVTVTAAIAYDPVEAAWRGTMTWTNNSFITLFFETQFKKHTDTDWTEMFVPDGALTSETDVGISLDPSLLYDFQVRSLTPAGKASVWVQVLSVIDIHKLDYSDPSNSMYLPLLQF